MSFEAERDSAAAAFYSETGEHANGAFEAGFDTGVAVAQEPVGSAPFVDIPNPRKVSRDELAATLRWAAELVDEDDSAQAVIQYAWSDEPGLYDLAGVVRFGNQMGQGSVRILGQISTEGGDTHGS